ncbi:patatin-like phospholipase family protein [Sphingomonas sp. SUN019]|uniref:patatin-like phospholipase family protein n=1 Tax=Sphingomonas sp. SUN019 TaxID=2937788 RepID=UPI00216471F7|nr:patatin-like phospholipase family protein [Sphingomonas sp. SUN019]UVO49532.1 patatin-like phospholipase family protein [Sphingomonas sp. SUN019]
MASRLALVLSGGGAKGAFQVGVLDALINTHGVKPAIVIGTSTGAIQALGVAQGDVDKLLAVWLGIKGDRDIYRERGVAGAILFGEKAIFDAAPLRRLLKSFADPVKLAASPVDMRLGVVSLQAGEFRTIDKSVPDIHNWVYASCAMPVFFDPLQTSDRQQWVDGGVRDVTPLGAALELNPTGVLVVRASPAGKSDTTKRFGGIISIGLRAVDLLQSEVSRNDLANTSLINDMLAARDQVFTALQANGSSAAEASRLLLALDKQISKYRFAQVRVIEPEESFSDTLEFDPAKIRRAIDAGRAAVEEQWPVIERLVI